MPTTGSSFSHYTEANIINWLRGTAPPIPPGLWVGLFTVMPNDNAGSGTEVSTSGTGYARVQLTGGNALSAPAAQTSGSLSSNSGIINFPVPVTNWGTIVGFAIFDAATGGNMLLWSPLTSAVAVGPSTPASFATGALQFLVD